MLAIIIGWQTRIAAFLLAGYSLLTALIFHANFADQVEMVMFLKNVSIAGGLLLLVANGAGAWSLDSRRCRVRGAKPPHGMEARGTPLEAGKLASVVHDLSVRERSMSKQSQDFPGRIDAETSIDRQRNFSRIVQQNVGAGFL